MKNNKILLFLLLIPIAFTMITCQQNSSDANINRSVINDGLLDDFNDFSDPNNWGGPIKIYASPGAEHIQTEYSIDNDRYGKGGGYKMTYSLKNATEWTAVVFFLSGDDSVRNLSSFTTLSFWVKAGDDGKAMKVKLVDNQGDDDNNVYFNVTTVLGGPITTSWQKVSVAIPGGFSTGGSGLSSWTDCYKMVFAFEYDFANSNNYDTSGSVYIDDLKFE